MVREADKMNNQDNNNSFSIPGANLQPIRLDTMENSVNQVGISNNNVIPTIVTGDNVNNNTVLSNGMLPINNSQNNNVDAVNNTKQVNPLLDDTPFTNEIFNDGSDIILTKDYFKYLLLIFILPIGFIVYLVKIFSKNESKNIKNLSKALLLFSFILVVAVGALYLLFIRIY